MKKNRCSWPLSLKFLERVVLLTIMATSFLCFSAQSQAAQTQRISLNLKNVPLSEVFQELNKQTSFKFFYNDAQVKNVGAVSLQVTSEGLNKVLDEVFKNTRYTYQIAGEQVIVVDRKSEQPQEIKIEGKVVGKDSMPVIGAAHLSV